MKKQILTLLIATLTLLIAALCLGFSSYQIQEETLVINVEVPVRVFKGNTFVDNLTIEDFEIYEDGKLQKTEAVYLIKKKSIERREEKKRFSPQTSRHFYLWFEISEYMPRISEAIRYFFDTVFFSGDNLVIVTPLKAYHLKGSSFRDECGRRNRKSIDRYFKERRDSGKCGIQSCTERPSRDYQYYRSSSWRGQSLSSRD